MAGRLLEVVGRRGAPGVPEPSGEVAERDRPANSRAAKPSMLAKARNWLAREWHATTSRCAARRWTFG